MVYIVEKKIGNHKYLYLQESHHISYHKGISKKKTKYYAYLGKARKYTSAQLNSILFAANHSTKKEFTKLIKEYPKRKSRT